MQRPIQVVLIITLFVSVSVQSVFADAILEEIRQAITEHGAAWTAGPNPVWNLPESQREMRYGIQDEPSNRSRIDPSNTGKDLRLPSAFDWRDVDGLDYISGIRNQLDCGSCWAFGALVCMEAKYAIDLEIPFSDLDLSEQSLVSCSNGGCNGWNKPATCNYLQSVGAPCESCLPYEADDTIPCDSQCSFAEMEMLRVDDWGYTNGTIEGIKERVLEGPVYVDFDVYEDFNAYTGGVYEHVYGEYDGGHGVAIIGWSDTDSCWICKNSWGPDWGENGYFRMKWGECRIENNSIWLTVEPARRPNLSISGIELDELSGDGDGIVNPGERAGLSFWLVNNPFWSSAFEVSIELSSSDRVSVIQGSQIIQGEVCPGDSVFCFGELEIEFPENSPVETIDLAVTLQSNSGMEYEYFKPTTIPVAPSLSMPGWPISTDQRFTGTVACFEYENNTCLASGDYAGNLHLFDSSGIEYAGWPITPGGSIRSAPSIADLDDDGDPEIIVGTMANTVVAYRMNGQEYFQADVGRSVVAPVAVFDICGDSRPEVIAATMGGDLWVLDSTGNPIQGWPVDLGSMILGGPGLVQYEGMHLICSGGTDGNLHLLDAGANELPGWPVDMDESIRTGPVSTEISGDHTVRIFCASDRSVSMLDISGGTTELYRGSSFIRSSIITVDMNGDNSLEIVFATSDMNVHVIDQNGEYLPGWPQVFEGSAYSEFAAVDLNADEMPELIFTTDWGIMYILDGAGNVLPPSPIRTNLEFLSEPTIADLDGDNDVEAIIGTETGLAAYDFKDIGAQIVWGTHRKDVCRTGFWGTITLASPEMHGKPDNPVLDLLACYPIPTNDSVMLQFTAPKDHPVFIELYDLSGKRLMMDRIEIPATAVRQRLSLKTFPAGAYHLRLRSGDNSVTRRILHIP